MGYRFPRRKLKTRDAPDPSLFREAISGVAEELAGNLNEHNVVEGALPAARAAPAYLYDFHAVSVASDGGIDTNGVNPDFPDAASGTAWQVPDGGEWATVGSMTQTYTAGDHNIWAIGWCYYGLVTSTFSFGAAATVNAPRVQFALRVNGTVMQETITGTERPDEGAPRTVTPLTPIVNATTFKTLDYETIRGTGSFSWHVRTMRVQCQVQVPQGSTTVELVARRTIAPMVNVNTDPPPVYVFNRQLVAVEMKLGGTDVSAGQSVPIVYPVDGDALDAANTNTSQLQAVVAVENALLPDAIKRAGLRKENLPRPQLYGGGGLGTNTSTTPGNTVKVYPGWVPAVPGSTGVSPNWDLVLAAVLNDGSGDWNFTNNPGFVIVLANVAFQKAAGSGNTPQRYGVFGIGTVYAGLGTSLQSVDQGWVNNPNIQVPDIVSYDCDTDVPMLAFFDYRSAPPAGGAVDQFRLLASCWNTSQVDWANSSIFVYIFRP